MSNPFSRIDSLEEEELDTVLVVQGIIYLLLLWAGFWYMV